MHEASNILEDFGINLGGGNIVINLDGQFKMVKLTAFLTEQSPTKASIDVSVYGDGNELTTLTGFNTITGKVVCCIDVTNVKTLEIDASEHTYAWVGESTIYKPDTSCHFNLRAYTEAGVEWNDIEQ